MKKSTIKTIIIIVLAVLVAVEGIGLVFRGGRAKDNTVAISLNLNFDGLGDAVGASVKDIAAELVPGLSSKSIPSGSITNAVKGVVFSDFVVNSVASIACPLLYQTLTELRMLDYGKNLDLFATGPLFATKLEGKNYTCIDTDGQRKPLTDVLNAVGENWEYMNTKVTFTDEDGIQRESVLWYTIQWGVKDEESFFAALNDIGEGMRGALEVTLQGKERIVNVNVPEVLIGSDSIPINMDAATIFNEAGGGYENGLVPLFTSLGLEADEYPAVEEFKAYESTADMWKAIFNPIFKLVEKGENDPAGVLSNLLLNFADLVETGRLRNLLATMRMDAKFNKLASLAMNFSDGLLFNLGDALIKIIEGFGLNLSGSFNDLIDSLPAVILKKPVNLPEMNVQELLACGEEKTLTNGSKVYVADSEKVFSFLAGYILDDGVISAIVNATDLAGTPDGNALIAAAGKSEEGLKELGGTIIKIVLEKLKQQ